MRILKINTYKILLFILVVLPIYQDSPLGHYFGAAGYTLIMLLSLILCVLYVVVKGKYPKSKFLWDLNKLGIWLAIVGDVGIIVWILCGKPIMVLGEFLPYKALKVIAQYFAYPAYVALLMKQYKSPSRAGG